jgi:CheY-like chemotaxis protein
VNVDAVARFRRAGSSKPGTLLERGYLLEGTVALSFPTGALRLEESMSASPATPGEPAPLKGRRILVIEDEYYLAEDLAQELKSLGAQIVGPVGRMEEAASIVDNGTPIDGAILDINLHSEMIFPLARTLRLRRVPFVFATGYGATTIAPEFKDVLLWEKPIDVPAMARGLSGLIQKQ